jgi:putative transposase
VEEHVPIDPIPGRKTPAKGVKIQSVGPTILLLTVCTKNRTPWLAQEIVQSSLEETWRKADAWLVGYYLLMPDHLHLFCAPRDLRFTVEDWTTFWKRDFSRKHSDRNWEWQRSAFHYRLRDPRQNQKKWQYVLENPGRKKLCASPAEWLFTGMIHKLCW